MVKLMSMVMLIVMLMVMVMSILLVMVMNRDLNCNGYVNTIGNGNVNIWS